MTEHLVVRDFDKDNGQPVLVLSHSFCILYGAEKPLKMDYEKHKKWH